MGWGAAPRESFFLLREAVDCLECNPHLFTWQHHVFFLTPLKAGGEEVGGAQLRQCLTEAADARGEDEVVGDCIVRGGRRRRRRRRRWRSVLCSWMWLMCKCNYTCMLMLSAVKWMYRRWDLMISCAMKDSVSYSRVQYIQYKYSRDRSPFNYCDAFK